MKRRFRHLTVISRIRARRSARRLKALAYAQKHWLISGGTVVLGSALLTAWALKPFYLKAREYDLSHLENLPVKTILYDSQGAAIGQLFVENRVMLREEEIPDNMRKTILAAEDRRFYWHMGIDPLGILRALRSNLTAGRITQGGSTLTQQLAKQVIGDYRRRYSRKFVEMFVALRLEMAFTKSEILTHYLNRVYFGSGYFGLEAAAQGYFGKPASGLTLEECAVLAAIVRAPASYSPRQDMKTAKDRAARILDVMRDEGWISEAERASKTFDSIRLVPRQEQGLTDHVLERAVAEARDILELDQVEQPLQGLRIYTTVDYGLQERMARIMREQVEGWAAREKKKADSLDWAVVACRAGSGDILAYLGSKDFNTIKFDNLRQSKRDFSALAAPWLYLRGMRELELSPATLVDSSWLPEKTPDKEAVQLVEAQPDRTSILLEDMLVFAHEPTLRRLAFQLKDPTRAPGPAGGSFTGQAIMDWLPFYQAVQRDGKYARNHFISRIETASGDLLYRRPVEKEELFPAWQAEQVRTALQKHALREAELGAKAGKETVPAVYGGVSPGGLDAYQLGGTSDSVLGIWIGGGPAQPLGDLASRLVSGAWNQLFQSCLGLYPKEELPPEPEAPAEASAFEWVKVDRRTSRILGVALPEERLMDGVMGLNPGQLEALRGYQNALLAAADAPVRWSDWFATLMAPPRDAGPAAAASLFDVSQIPEHCQFRIPAVRGKLITRDGVVLAEDRKVQDLVLSWPADDKIQNEQDVWNWLSQRLKEAKEQVGVSPAITEGEALEHFRFRRFLPLTIAQALTEEQIEAFDASDLPRQGFALQGIPMRVYPRGTLLAHLMGYLSKSQKRGSGVFLGDEVIHDAWQGAAGLEAAFDGQLKGKEGAFLVSTGPKGFLKGARITVPAEAGKDVTLSIQASCQQALEQALAGGLPAAGVVIDVSDGSVAAMASYPNFDPNIFVPALSSDDWNRLSSDPRKPLLNRAVAQHQPPGSVFKVVTTLAAMSAGSFDPHRTVVCDGRYQIGNVVYNLPREHGTVSFLDAIAYSYNTYFFELALNTGRDALITTARKVGLGHATGFVLGETPGLIPDSEFVQKTHGRWMGPGDVTNMAIGQGDVLVTPLQIAVLMAGVANRGSFYQPTLVPQSSPTPAAHLDISPENWDWLHQGLRRVVTNGTARKLLEVPYEVAAKTGTAQVGADNNTQIAWTAGFFPLDAPRYAFAFMVEGQPGGDISSSSHAAPMAQAWLNRWAAEPVPEAAATASVQGQ
jgi:penicillin-binding protein 2